MYLGLLILLKPTGAFQAGVTVGAQVSHHPPYPQAFFSQTFSYVLTPARNQEGILHEPPEKWEETGLFHIFHLTNVLDCSKTFYNQFTKLLSWYLDTRLESSLLRRFIWWWSVLWAFKSPFKKLKLKSDFSALGKGFCLSHKPMKNGNALWILPMYLTFSRKSLFHKLWYASLNNNIYSSISQ